MEIGEREWPIVTDELLVKCQINNVKCQQCQMSNQQCQMSNVSNVKCQQCQMSTMSNVNQIIKCQSNCHNIKCHVSSGCVD